MGRKVRHSTGERVICRKNHGAGRCLNWVVLRCWVMYGTLAYRGIFSGTDTFQGYQTSVKRRLRRVQYCSFPPEGVTGTSGYRFEYNLHLIKIPSHLDRESIYSDYYSVCMHLQVYYVLSIFYGPSMVGNAVGDIGCWTSTSSSMVCGSTRMQWLKHWSGVHLFLDPYRYIWSSQYNPV